MVFPHGLDPCPDDLSHKAAAVDHQDGRPCDEDGHLQAEQREREKDDVELHEQGRIADQLDVESRRPRQPAQVRRPRQPDEEGDQAAERQTERAELYRVEEGLEQEKRIVPVERTLNVLWNIHCATTLSQLCGYAVCRKNRRASNFKAHIQHAHEGPGGTLRPQDVLP